MEFGGKVEERERDGFVQVLLDGTGRRVWEGKKGIEWEG